MRGAGLAVEDFCGEDDFHVFVVGLVGLGEPGAEVWFAGHEFGGDFCAGLAYAGDDDDGLLDGGVEVAGDDGVVARVDYSALTIVETPDGFGVLAVDNFTFILAVGDEAKAQPGGEAKGPDVVQAAEEDDWAAAELLHGGDVRGHGGVGVTLTGEEIGEAAVADDIADGDHVGADHGGVHVVGLGGLRGEGAVRLTLVAGTIEGVDADDDDVVCGGGEGGLPHAAHTGVAGTVASGGVEEGKGGDEGEGGQGDEGRRGAAGGGVRGGEGGLDGDGVGVRVR